MLLTSMMPITSDLIANKLASTDKNSIERVGVSNIVDKANVVGKPNMRVSKSGSGFFSPRAKLTFAKLR